MTRQPEPSETKERHHSSPQCQCGIQLLYAAEVREGQGVLREDEEEEDKVTFL
jgi:hypothetical protein